MGLLSNHIRDIRLAKVAPWLGGDVLDLGCGPGEILRRYADRISHYVGVDVITELVQGNQERFPQAEFRCEELDSDALDFDRKFDAILMVALIEHIFNQKFLFQQAKAALKPDGIILITTPTPFGNDIVHRAGTAIGLFAQAAVDDHIVIYNRRRFQVLAAELGLTIAHYETFEFGCNQFAVLKAASA